MSKNKKAGLCSSRRLSVHTLSFGTGLCEFMCMSVYTAKSVFLLGEEVTSTLCPVSCVHTTHTPTPSGSRGPCSVWSGAAPWLIYFLPGTTAVCGWQCLSGRQKDGKAFLFNLQNPTTLNCTFHPNFKQKPHMLVTTEPTSPICCITCVKLQDKSSPMHVWDAETETCCWSLLVPSQSNRKMWFKNRILSSDNPFFFSF